MSYIYDCETFPNFFVICVIDSRTKTKFSFEISHRKNDHAKLIDFVLHAARNDIPMVGFNNIGFDYPVLHFVLKASPSVGMIYEKAMAIIKCEDRFTHTVRPFDHIVRQIDLFKIHHFDNRARMTSLKALEFNMEMVNIKDLPFPVGDTLTSEQMDVLTEYCFNDVEATRLFYEQTREKITFREQLTEKYGKDFTNFSDVRIGKEIFQISLEAAGVTCYDYSANTGRIPRQTLRTSIRLADCVPSYIHFNSDEFDRIKQFYERTTISVTKGAFKDLSATVRGIEYVFGTGGIHASVEAEQFRSDDTHMIYDIDVTSLYPSIAIENGYYPEHLTEKFVEVYSQLRERRVSYEKGSAENAMLKLALNGVYGASNDAYSIFYDPLFTMKITITGQLVIAMLIERLLSVAGVEIIQANTDGITMFMPRTAKTTVDRLCSEWEKITRLHLESVEYRVMAVADVNNYIAQTVDGKVKRKGRYDYMKGWHQDASSLVIPKVAEKVIIDSAPIRETVEKWPNFMDFMLRVKVNRGSTLVLNNGHTDIPLENTQRYYIAQGGMRMFKTMPPLAKAGPMAPRRRFSLNSEARVCPCNNLLEANLPVDFGWYVREVEKLVLGVI